MSQPETFAPTVRMPEGDDYTPAGWEWVLAFAVAGCEWAIKEADKPEFRERIKADLRQRRRERIQKAIDYKLAEVEDLRRKLEEPDPS